ncbi:D-alanyl-D-alanine carboxypeptidase [Microvirga flavescens]|uniref:D-alanyl-D-alanine carboxypeptidase n=1 Tax=Microvirga flavescens TaxID=2249811 RepID=UPI000DDA547F|nr:D-alanyl-D-alanine carboxypeptidase [Microvirga flavescens]
MNLVRVWAGSRKFAVAVGITATVAVALSSPAEAARKKRSAGGGYNPPYATMVVDVKTGRTLQALNEDELRHPASVTKVMTLYLLFERLEQGKLTLNSPLQISANAARQAPSKLGLASGSTIEVEDAILALVTKSANDIAVAVAENLAGSEGAFAEQMTRKARALGMSRTVYRNASGLPNPGQITTARDLTILARAIQDRFPKYYPYFGTHVFRYAGASHKNHNNLLGRVEGVDGIKTGFTTASGFNLMTNVKTDDRHIVAIVLGGRSAGSRDQAMASLVGSTLPRAYAGARTTPAVGESRVMVADASPPQRPAVMPSVETTAATTPAPAPIQAAAPQVAAEAPAQRKPLDLNSLRPVVASAAGASTTTTPSSTVRWQKGPEALPKDTQAYAALHAEAAAMPPQTLSPQALSEPKAQERVQVAPVAAQQAPAPAPTKVAALEPKVEVKAEAKTVEAKAEAKRPAMSPWIIQLGATDDEAKAKDILDSAKSKAGKILLKASAFTEKVSRDGSTLYRARFSGFSESGEAEGACKVLKRSGFSCFASRS